MFKTKKNLMPLVNEAVYLWHDHATLGLDETLFVNNEIQKIKQDKQFLNVLSTRYFIYNGNPILYKNEDVSFDIWQLNLEYDKINKEFVVVDDEQLEEKVLEWDNLPKLVSDEVSKYIHSSLNSMTYDILIDLEEWYLDLNKINFKDFPKIFRPFIKKIVKNKKNQFNFL